MFKSISAKLADHSHSRSHALRLLREPFSKCFFDRVLRPKLRLGKLLELCRIKVSVREMSLTRDDEFQKVGAKAAIRSGHIIPNEEVWVWILP